MRQAIRTKTKTKPTAKKRKEDKNALQVNDVKSDECCIGISSDGRHLALGKCTRSRQYVLVVDLLEYTPSPVTRLSYGPQTCKGGR